MERIWASGGYISPVSANARYISYPGFVGLSNTGDLSFYTFGGELNLLGKADDQVIVNGVRMNLDNIGRVLRDDTSQHAVAELGSDALIGDQFIVVLLHV
jgi:hypothetical protein